MGIMPHVHFWHQFRPPARADEGHRTRRRAFLTVLAGALTVSAQRVAAQKRMPHIVYFWLGRADSEDDTLRGFRAGLSEIGYQEGRNIIVDYRCANGSEKRLAELASAAVAEHPDLIVTFGAVVTRPVAKLTRTIPIVSVNGDPVGGGFAASLAHPGGNITGLSIQAGPELEAKWLELLLELVPRARRIAILRNALNPITATEFVLMRSAAQRLARDFAFEDYPIRLAAEVSATLDAIRRAKPDALVVDNDPLLASKVAEIAAVRLPAISGSREFVKAGLLFSCGASILDVVHRTGSYIDRILKGAKPGDLPIEQPTKFELVINLMTARALGLTIPASVLARADELIE